MYCSYWIYRVLHFLLDNKSKILSVQDIADATGITINDIQYILVDLEILRRTQTNKCFMYTEPEYLKQILKKKGRPFREVQRDKIHWVP